MVPEGPVACSQEPATCPCLSWVDLIHTLPTCFLKIHFTVILLSVLQSSRCSVSLSFRIRSQYPSLFPSHTCHIPSHLIHLHSIIWNNIWSRILQHPLFFPQSSLTENVGMSFPGYYMRFVVSHKNQLQVMFI